MAITLDSLSRDALDLPPDQRITLAHRILMSMEPTPDQGVDAAWEAEIAQRIEKFDAEKSQTISASEVFSSLSKIAPEA